MTDKFIVKEKMGEGQIDSHCDTFKADNFDSRKELAEKIFKEEGAGEYYVQMQKKGERGFTPALWRFKMWKNPAGNLKWKTVKDNLSDHVEMKA